MSSAAKSVRVATAVSGNLVTPLGADELPAVAVTLVADRSPVGAGERVRRVVPASGRAGVGLGELADLAEPHGQLGADQRARSPRTEDQHVPLVADTTGVAIAVLGQPVGLALEHGVALLGFGAERRAGGRRGPVLAVGDVERSFEVRGVRTEAGRG